MASRRVLISIVNWNGGDTLFTCLESLSRSQFQSFDIVVVDNASVDGSVRKLRRDFPDVTVVQNSENLGFCGGQNQGLRLALQRSYEYVWVLNHDTSIAATALGFLVAELDDNATVGMVSPVIVDEGDDGGIQYCGTSIDWDLLSFRNWEALGPALEAQKSSPTAFFLWGTALLIRVSALTEIGQLDHRFFAYYEDYDLSLRSVRSGFVNRIVASARISHSGKNDSSQRPPHHVYFNTRNRALFWIKHLPLRRRPGFWREYLAGALIRASCFEEVGDMERMNATLLAIWDAVKGRGGPYDRNRAISPMISRLLTAHPYLLADILRGNFTSIFRRQISR